MVKKLFETPDSLPATTFTRCLKIPASQEWLGIFNKALLLLTQEFNYEQVNESDLHPETVAAVCYQTYLQYLQECEGAMDCAGCLDLGPPETGFVRVENGVAQWSPDGSTWIDLPAGPTGPTVPSPAPTLGATDDIKRCIASSNALAGLNEFYKATFGAAAAGLQNALNTLNNFLFEVNRILFQLVYSPEEGILEAALFDPPNLATNFSAPGLTQEAQDILLCMLYDNSSVDGESIVRFDWQAVHDNAIAELGINPGTAITLMLGYIGADGLDRAGGIQFTQTADCSACGEPNFICVGFDVPGSYTIVPDLGTPGGTLDAGFGNPAPAIRWSVVGQNAAAKVEIDLGADRHVTQIKWNVFDNASPNAIRGYLWQCFDTNGNLLQQGNQNINYPATWQTPTFNVNVAGVRKVRVRVANSSTIGLNANLWIDNVCITWT